MFSPELLLQSTSDSLFGLICHQDSAVLVEINGRTLMLCPRCSGLHAGFMLTALAYWLPWKRSPRVTGSFTKWFAIPAISILAAEWLLAQVQLIVSSAESRYLSGLFAGSACLLLIMAYRKRQTHQTDKGRNKNQFHVIILTTAALLAGVLFTRLESWHVVTTCLLIAVVFNFLFFLFTLFLRVKFIFSNYKTRIP